MPTSTCLLFTGALWNKTVLLLPDTVFARMNVKPMVPLWPLWVRLKAPVPFVWTEYVPAPESDTGEL